MPQEPVRAEESVGGAPSRRDVQRGRSLNGCRPVAPFDACYIGEGEKRAAVLVVAVQIHFRVHHSHPRRRGLKSAGQVEMRGVGQNTPACRIAVQIEVAHGRRVRGAVGEGKHAVDALVRRECRHLDHAQ